MREKVEKLLQDALDEKEGLFLIDLSISPAHQIKVIIDGDQGVTVQDCIDISRAIEHQLDREETDFSLEVLSAGVSEPLQMTRQYVKNVGRKLKVKTEAETVEGALVAADDTAITLQWKAREPKPVGKGKHTVQKEAVISYADILEAKVMVTFN
ncbi:MAG: ribosome assembly cofactor RimP [Flavobacteriaceae bacterium]|uniref:ribosome assembly cofactor RimP n=1 Tax=Leeuwenhoekiella sp. UBA1003 TaxID=1946744 RepID=UPI000C8C2270|nr:ribosome assembly cofactor RimP [Leeuwenhoekiella sp. UBA1003]MAT90027.1 ribosome assembly cofactor RimP [Flavobacteriaceae bacterium]|tara:strand:- start:7396 stop:7857 length:462 start_codon:yes stop_codon:yes gene_type:complete